jgi:hypothetical protein
LCSCPGRNNKTIRQQSNQATGVVTAVSFDSSINTIHVLVALCDNKYQGIVKVPPAIGNGQDPDNNLYWGCSYGIRSFFKTSKEWTLVSKTNPDTLILERIIFKHKTKNWYLVADAYNGRYIKACTRDFFYSCSGQLKNMVMLHEKKLGINGNSKMLAYIGHDGLMEFSLDDEFVKKDDQKRDCIILACISKPYFEPIIRNTGANPLLWTTGLMCPEGYTLHDAISTYINNGNPVHIRESAANAYAKYQKCGSIAAKNLLVSGW